MLLVWDLSCRKGHELKFFSIHSHLLLVLCATLDRRYVVIGETQGFPSRDTTGGGGGQPIAMESALHH